MFFSLLNVLQASEAEIISTEETQAYEIKRNSIWLTDFAKAKELSKKEKKPLLMAILGPGWCPWSDKLESEVLSRDEFLQGLQQEMIFLRVNFPENFVLFSDGELECIKIKEAFSIQECPSLILVDVSGQEIVKLNYLPLAAKEFGEYVKGLLFDFRFLQMVTQESHLKNLAFDQLKSLYQKAKLFHTTIFKESILKTGLKKDQDAYFLIEQYGDLYSQGKSKKRERKQMREKILAKDPKNEQGIQLKLALLDFEKLSNVLKKPKKSSTVIHPLLEYVKQFGRTDRENGWRVEMMIAEYLFGQNQIDDALKHAQASYDSAPENAKKEISESIEYLRTQLTR